MATRNRLAGDDQRHLGFYQLVDVPSGDPAADRALMPEEGKNRIESYRRASKPSESDDRKGTRQNSAADPWSCRRR